MAKKKIKNVSRQLQVVQLPSGYEMQLKAGDVSRELTDYEFGCVAIQRGLERRLFKVAVR